MVEKTRSIVNPQIDLRKIHTLGQRRFDTDIFACYEVSVECGGTDH
jgi:hypothetical protein